MLSDMKNTGNKNERTTQMGMSASQARFLSLTARKTNVEYEGQQINQQRTALSNESSNYYSQLTSMSVPVPPSSADYTKITYTFADGSEKNTVTSIVATTNTKSTGIYMLNYIQEIPTDSMVVSGTNIVTKTGSNYYIGAVELQVAGTGDSAEKFIAAGIPKEVVNQYSAEERANKLEVEKQYVDMATAKYGDENWKVRYVKSSAGDGYEPVLYSKKELDNADYNEKTGASLTGIKQFVFGQSTETREIKNAEAKVEQDSNGRYISLFIYDDKEHTSGTKYDLTTTTESDEAAYNDAMNKYYYEKAQYDQEIQEVNSKIEIIQVQDKNLELKLKQLDTEQNAISTEMDAVKKVISKNVESSFKTFNA